MRYFFLAGLVALALLAGLRTSASAAISGNGDLSPADPNTWTSSDDTLVGNTSSGTLTVNGGSVLLSNTSRIGKTSSGSGLATVSGSGSTWSLSSELFVGNEGTGSLNIENGGIVNSGSGYISLGSISTGVVTVTGTGSTWNVSALNIGYNASGTLTISSGGSVSNGVGTIGRSHSNALVAVTGAGSTWNNDGDLTIGDHGSGTLTIADGGSVIVSGIVTRLGVYEDTIGAITISGSASSWMNTGQVWVGLEGSGTITQNDGYVNVGGLLHLSNGTTSTGIYNLNGGTLSVGALGAGSGTYALNLNGGILAASQDFDTSINATLSNTATINTQGRSVTWDGVLSGAGSLVKAGAGTLTLNGTNSYTGDTNVNAGTLLVNGTITSAVLVALDGTLGGTGMVGSVVNQGAVAPGNSTAVLNIAGNYTQESGSTLNIQTDASGNCSSLNVIGIATINGGTVSVGTTGGYTTGTQYTFLTSGTLDVATDASIVTDSAFLTATLGYNAKDMWFSLAGNGRNYVDEAHTRNQYDVANYLDAHRGDGSADFRTVLNALNLQSGDGARAAFDAMGGEIHSGLATISIENNERFLRSISQQMQMHSMAQGLDFTGDRADPSLVYVSRVTSALDRRPNRLFGWTTWAEGYGVGASLAGNDNASGLGYSTAGLTVGMERQLDERTLLGFAGGYVNSHTTLQARNDGAEINGGQFAAYLYREFGDGYMTGTAGYGHNTFDVSRTIEFGDIDRAAASNYDGNNYSTYLEVGRNIRGRRLHYQPFAALEYIGVRQDAFTESGADSIDLDTQALNANAFRSLLGTRLLGCFRTQSDRLLTWNASVTWRHEFLNDGRVLDASFVGQTDAAFAIYGANVDRDAAIFGTGLNYALSPHCSLYANYDLVFSRNYTANAGLGGFQYAW